jgi:cyanophycinase-like exopeptidase
VSAFLLLGSGEFEPWGADVERIALGAASGDGSVVILPTASAPDGDAVFDRWGTMGRSHFAELGVPAEVLPVKTREDAARADLADRARAASMVYLSGGKPQHAAKTLAGTPVWAAILEAIGRGAVYTGCSAGAMIASQSKVQRDGSVGGTGWRFGLGLVPNVSFGVHWDRASRIPGITWFMSSGIPDGSWFVGIDERTAILGDGTAWEVHGLGGASVRRDGSTAAYASGERFATS